MWCVVVAAAGIHTARAQVNSGQSPVFIIGGGGGEFLQSPTGHGGVVSPPTPGFNYDAYFTRVSVGQRMEITAPSVANNGNVFSHWVGCNLPSPRTQTCLVSVGPTFAGVTAIYTSANSKLMNISARAFVGTGDNVLIGGFVVTGGTKQVIIRGAGPSLALSGIRNTLNDPVINLYSGQTIIASNDDWRDNSNVQSIQATGLAPTNGLEAALLVTLAPGPYTVIMSGLGGTTGIGLLSIDDLDPFSSPARLSNISARAYMGTSGEDQLIAGFILQGQPKEVFVAGVGQSLVPAGVRGAVSDPALTMFDGRGFVLATNDDWQTSSRQLDIGVRTVYQWMGGYPLESAIVNRIQAGAYTAIMRGLSSPGIGLVSVEE